MNFAPFSHLIRTPQVTYIGFTYSSSTATTYTFTNVNLGSSGLCVITIHGEITGSAGRFITSALLNGVTMSVASSAQSALNSTGVGAQIYQLTQPSRTGTIVINFSGSNNRCGVGIYNILYNQSQVSGVSSNANSGRGLTSPFTSLNQDIAGISAYTIGLDTVTGLSWSNATQTYNFGGGAIGASRFSSATFLTTASASRTISTTHSNSTQPLALATATWR